jgi:uncharacterized repeat protein (TIGR02543 family)
VITLTSAANAGYTFAGWGGDTGGATNPVTVTIVSDKTAIADFSTPSLTSPTLVSPAINGLSMSYAPTLDWADVTPVADHYEVQVDDNADFSSLAITQTTITSAFTPSTSLAPNTVYYWRVRAFNVAGQFSPWSAVRSFRTALAPPPSNFPDGVYQPQSLRPFFDWDSTDGASSYNLQIASDPNFAAIVVNMNVTPPAHIMTTDLPRGVTLYWRVRGNSPYGAGNWSPVRSFDTPNLPGTPIPVSPGGGAVVTSRTPVLDWTDSFPAADRYEVQIATNNDFTNVVARGQSSVSQYTPETPLAANTVYYWRVRAIGGNSPLGQILFSDWSSAMSFKTPP